ncbi:sulfur carrier protein ThiS [Xanthobacter autotrophicus]|jgi:sulfur carrier protein|uniref:Sulfur carrier protein ThiS n=1 Tax=Xanthobacter autotrophicus TaxID=280 RepID=A0A6C1KR63_XANAU|nr:sulfur carrier protein ThiS [Xanthobacter autotrophicus]TLX40903.1 sulfur carrier protein ThiS [Xanthobacter autotrophicus]
MVLALKVNGTPEDHQAATVADLLRAKGLDPERKGIAVAVNGAVVPRRTWGEAALAAGDAVEIIEAKQGG